MRRITGHTDFTDALRGTGVVGNDLLAVDWGRRRLDHRDMAEPPPDHRSGDAVLALCHVDGLGTGADVLLQRRLSPETLGVKYAWVLGARADEVWGEIWPDIGPRIEHVLEQERGPGMRRCSCSSSAAATEETYHTFSYSPVYDDASRIAGMLCVVTEVTERVIGERRIAYAGDLDSVATLRRWTCARAARLLRAAGGHTVPCPSSASTGRRGRSARASTTGPNPATGAPYRSTADADGYGPRARFEGSVTGLDEGSNLRPAPDGRLARRRHEPLVCRCLGRRDRACGFIVVGMNPCRPLDDVYRSFIDLFAGHSPPR